MQNEGPTPQARDLKMAAEAETQSTLLRSSTDNLSTLGISILADVRFDEIMRAGPNDGMKGCFRDCSS